MAITYPIKDINLVLRACNPAEPLPPGDPRWYDFTSLRGSSVVNRFKRELLASPAAGDYHHRCLCGHRGSGKSTELLLLKDWADKNGFLGVSAEVDVHFGGITLQVSDIFLLAATVVEGSMTGLGSPLPKGKLFQVVRRFADVTEDQKVYANSELSVEAGVQVKSGIPFLGNLFAKFSSGVKAGSQLATTVRQHMLNYPDTLLDMTNELLDEANKSLMKLNRPNGVLLILDNLDRYEPEQIERLLMQGANLINRMKCHSIFTIPIDVEYNPQKGPIQDNYGPTIVLPMPRIRRESDGWESTVSCSGYDKKALAQLLEALAKRLEIEALFEKSALADVELLVKMSGGCMRDLLHLVNIAFQFAGDRFTHESVIRGIEEYRATLARRLTDEDYRSLALIALRNKAGDAALRRLLFNRWALSYSGEGGVEWFDVHPLIIETKGFQSAYKGGSKIKNKQ